MRRLALVVAVLLALAVCALAQDAEAPKGVKLPGPHNPFTIVIPEGWQHQTFESKTDKPDEKSEFKLSVFGDKYLPTDNFNLWWYEGELAALDKGSISVHRVELPAELTPDKLPEQAQKDPKLPKDAEAKLLQFGKYVGLHIAGTIEDMGAQSVLIANGKVAYVGLLMGPKDAVKEQSPKFLQLMGTLDATDVKPAKAEDFHVADALRPGEVRAKNNPFGVIPPQGWQHSIYDNPDDKPNAKLIMQIAPIAGKADITDNMNFWWGPMGESMAGGLASIHRLEAQDPVDMVAMLNTLKQSGKLPQGMDANLAQVGDYVGLVAGGTFQNIFYGAAVVIAQGKSIYLASILGPVAVVQPKWNDFIKMVSTLKAPDLKPQKLEDLK